MARGRKPLDTDIRLQRRQESLQRYAEKNAEALRTAARLRMQQWVLSLFIHIATHSHLRTQENELKFQQGTTKLGQDTRRRLARPQRDIGSRRLRRNVQPTLQDDYSAKHFGRKKVPLKPKTKPRHGGKLHPASQSTTGSKSKSRAHREARPTPLHTAAIKIKRCGGHVHQREEKKEDNFSDDSGGERRRHHCSESPIFTGRIKPRTVVPPPCPKCGEVGCPGCACMCMESMVWIEHEGGHFFPTCKSCGGDECPGCACTCPLATEWIEHGGHLAT
ncbi:hypothetical protein B0H19DRAFT_1079145 [Mycena capillaripes]|nr:hypothetical protein B0H19DRAFT_1079145 [Mycena capillaripes]